MRSRVNDASSDKTLKNRILEALKTQTGFLMKSIQDFDDGEYTEALRMSLALRIILHSKGRQVSLLDRLRINNMLFLDTCGHDDPRNLAPWIGLVSMASDGSSAILVPNGMRPPERADTGHQVFEHGGIGFQVDMGDGSEPMVPVPVTSPKISELIENDLYVDFDYWWNTIVINNKRGIYFSRRDVTLLLCDKDGGAHIDGELPEAYERMQKDPDFFFKVVVAENHIPYDFPPAYACVRAIAGETVTSIKRNMHT